MDVEQLKTTLPEVVSLLESKAPGATALAVVDDGLRIRVDNREQQVTQNQRAAGVVLRVPNGPYFDEYSTTQLERDSLLAEARAWLGTLSLDPGTPDAPNSARGHVPGAHDFSTDDQIDPRTVPLAEKFERVKDHQARARSLDSRIANAQIMYMETSQDAVFAGSGQLMSQHVGRTLIFTTLVVRDDAGNMQYEWESHGGRIGFELWDSVEKDRTLEDVCATALRLLNAERIPGGTYDCITSPDVSGTVAHESFGHGVETDMFLKGRALAAQYVGRRVAPDYVGMVDDPTLPGAFGGYFFDDEGQVAGPTEIIQDGIFRQGISDAYSASRLGIPRTGNGRRQNFSRKAYARMSNTFFQRGSTPVDHMIAGMDDGIYLTRMDSGMEDPKNWGIQLIMHYGKEIKNGKFTGRLFSPVAMTGSVLDVLASISQVGDDFKMDTGFCGKGHKEYIPVSAGGPHLRLRATLS